MRLVFNLAVWRENEEAINRKTRRLAYMAAIAESEGHAVTIHNPANRNPEFDRVLKIPFVNDTVGRMDVLEGGEEDLFAFGQIDGYFMSHATTLNQPCVLIPHALAPRVYFKESLGCADDAHLARHGAAIISYVQRQRDFTDNRPRAWCEAVLQSEPITRRKIISAPWLPHERVLDLIHRDGLWRAFIDDNLAPIRRQYCAAKKRRYGGFVGKPWAVRQDLAATLGTHYEFKWAGHGLPQLSPREYLKWLSECRVSLGLPGDTWKCSRFLESVLLGVPCVQQAGTININPPLTADNCVLVDRFDDPKAIDAAVPRFAAIAERATRDYTEGWSLRGQFRQIIRKLERHRDDPKRTPRS